ncbi:hypothetical protein C8Q80DRAFT_68778 [Daedaleopsis nitida]|nr:hypothetical protein C8Q80DRAFT_68778 [Daedaleopsis nitida]
MSPMLPIGTHTRIYHLFPHVRLSRTYPLHSIVTHWTTLYVHHPFWYLHCSSSGRRCASGGSLHGRRRHATAATLVPSHSLTPSSHLHLPILSSFSRYTITALLFYRRTPRGGVPSSHAVASHTTTVFEPWSFTIHRLHLMCICTVLEVVDQERTETHTVFSPCVRSGRVRRSLGESGEMLPKDAKRRVLKAAWLSPGPVEGSAVAFDSSAYATFTNGKKGGQSAQTSPLPRFIRMSDLSPQTRRRGSTYADDAT